MRKKLLSVALSALMVVGTLSLSADPARASELSGRAVSPHLEEPAKARDASGNLSYEELMILGYTNKLRLRDGIESLSTFPQLQQAAYVRASELGTLFDHQRPDGSMCYTALDQAGITYWAAAENIAAGYSDPAMTIQQWWNSPGHHSNMMSADYDHMGVGYQALPNTEYGSYWVQLFTGGCTTSEIHVAGDDNNIYLLPAGESIDYLGLLLEEYCDHGVSYLPLLDEMCTGYDKTLSDAIQEVTVSHHGCTTTFYIYSYSSMTFTDVTYDSWYYGYVEYVYALELMTGLNDTYFGAADPLARAQFAVILYRMNGEPQVNYSARFPDVADGQWYTNAILWANDQGVVTGYADTGLFGPGDNINREQMAVMMYRFAQSKGYDTSTKADFSSYADASQVNEFAREAMQWAVGTGIISGKDNGTRLDPQGNANRAECATIITRFATTYGF